MRSVFRPALVICFLIPIVLSACGSSPSATTTTTSTPATTSTSTPATTSTTTVDHTTCSTGVLQATVTFGGAAAGESYYTVALKNTGPKSCVVEGYPTYKFFGASAAGGAGAGPALDLQVSHGGPAPAPVTVASGGSTDSIIVFTDVQSNGSSCVDVVSAEISPPGSSESISFPISFSPCGGGVTAYAFGAPGSETPQ